MDALRKRLKILLFPVIAPLILLGWILYVVGERQECSKAVNKRKNHDHVSAEQPNKNEDEVEMGLIDKIVEETAY